MTTEKLIIDWKQFDKLANEIVHHYKDLEITKIIGISRGGLPLGVTLSNRLKVPFEPISWQTRDGSARDVKRVIDLQQEADIKTTLFVDDICDSGKTIRQITQLVPDSRWVTLVNKIPQAVEFSPMLVDGDQWIVFPWE